MNFTISTCRKMSTSRGFLQPGDAAPDFVAKAAVRKGDDIAEVEIKLSDFKDKYLVLFFYPQDVTFVCPTEIIAFSEAAAQFKKINCEVYCSFNRFCLFSLGMDQYRPKTRRFRRDENPNF